MYLIVGLGNPGRAYQKSRHNVGFMVLDRLAAREGRKFRRAGAHSLTCGLERAGQAVLLAKPQTYMNLSGEAVRELVQQHPIELSRFLIVYDDLALPLGTIRIRASGSAGGQKGMKSVIEEVGTIEIPRLRIGIRPSGSPDDYSDYVLSDFSEEESDILEEVLDRTIQAIDMILTDGLERAMALYNAAPDAHSGGDEGCRG